MGKLENRSLAHDLSQADHAHRDRRATIRATPSCSTTPMSAATPWSDALRQLFRLPPNGKPMTIMQLAGFPAEVVDSVVSVLLPHGVRVRPVERRRVPAAVRLRGGASLRAGRPLDRFRPDPQGALAHRQGRPQIRRVPRAGHAAPGRARRHHHFAMLDAVRDAHGERPRPGDRALGGVGRGRPTCWPSCPRSARARCSRSAKAWRCRRGSSSSSFPSTSSRTARRSSTPDRPTTPPPPEDFIDTIIDRWRGATMSHSRPGSTLGRTSGHSRDEFSPSVVGGAERQSASQQPAPRRSQRRPRLDPDRFKLLKQPARQAAAACSGAASHYRAGEIISFSRKMR